MPGNDPPAPVATTTSSQSHWLGYNKDEVPRYGPYADWGPRPSGTKNIAGKIVSGFGENAYRRGAENTPVSSNPQEIANFQAALHDAGYLKTYRAMLWDEPTRKAFAKLMGDANHNAMSWQDYLTVAIQGAAIGGAAGGAGTQGDRQLPVFTIQNADDLKGVFRQVAQATIGHTPDEDEMNMLVTSFQGMQLSRQQRMLDLQRQQYDAQQAGQMGYADPVTMEEERQPTDYAQSELERRHPNEAVATRGVGQIEAALGYLQGGR